MTDSELIQILQDKAPEELSIEEIELLRERLRHSAELRDTLVGQLQMEEYISRALGRVSVSADDIYAVAAAQTVGRQRLLALLGWAGVLGLGIVALLWIVLPGGEKREQASRPAAAGGAGTRKVAAAQSPNDGGVEPREPDADAESSPAVAATEGPADAGGQTATPAAGAPAAGAPATARKSAAKPAQPAPAPEISVGEEWPELGPKAPRRPFAEAAFDDADGSPRGISKNQLNRWFTPVPGQNHAITEAPRGNVSVATLDGIVRLRPPWPADAILSFAPFDHHTLAIYFWNGTNGVSLHYYQHPRPTWVAYRTTRNGPEPRPATFSLVGTDGERYERSLAGTIDIRHQAGTLVMSRGDVRLVTAPLDEPPTEVYFDRHAVFRNFAMYRGEPVPDELPPVEPNVLADSRPAVLDWTTQLAPGAHLGKMGAGAMQLTADKAAAVSWAAVKVPRQHLYEVVLRLGDCSPGTGVYLGDDAGKPLHVLGVLHDQRTGQNVLGFLPPNAGAFETNVDLAVQPCSYITPGQWLRLVAGSGTVKCWVSGDGRHWGRAFDPARNVRGAWSHVGLIAFQTSDPRHITLEQIRVSELGALSKLADGKLLEQVPATVLAGEADATAWRARVQETLPEGTKPADWRTACALRMLATVPPASLGNVLLNGVLEDNLVRSASVGERLNVLNQVAELYDAWDQAEGSRLSQFYERLGRQLLREGERAPWSKIGAALLIAPIWTSTPIQAIPESLAHAELIMHVYDDQWEEIRQLCRRLRFFNRPAIPEQSWPDSRLRTKLLVEWAGANAERALGEKKPKNGNVPAPVAISWQHPLVVSLSKEGFNTLADLEATLGDQSYRDACQIILGVKPELALGLLPDGRDPRLMLSLPQAVDTAMRDYPGLRQTMVEQFGTLGRLRLQQALADASPQLLQALAVQFFGTSSAAAAHQWLGDRALADGDFAQAAAEFEIALHSAEAAQKGPLAARLRLAGAMLGRDEGEKVTEPVVFQNARLSAEAFEKLVAEMKSHAVAVGGAPLVAVESAPPVGVKPVRYEVQGRGAIPGDVGQNPGNPLSGDVDWAARQTGCTIAGKMLYISNRFQVSAFSLVSGKQHWSIPLGKEAAPTHSWGLVAMKPVIVGDRLFVRRLTKAGPELVCMNAVNGKVRWTSNPAINLASDPLILQDRLYIFTVATPLEDGLLSLDLSLVNPLTGEILSQQPVIQLRNLWDKQLNCEAAVVGARLVAVVGGTALCCDFTGKPLWVRRQIWIPPAQATAGNEQSAGAPLVVGNRLFVSQPGVFAIECLDLDTGRRVWQQPVYDIRRLIGVTGETLVAETSRGWQAFATATGKPLWQHDSAQILDAHVCPTSGNLLVAKREAQPNEMWRPVLVWLNAMTGREMARLPLDSLADKQPLLGPMLVHNERLWTFFGRGLHEPRRELFEFIPTTEAAQASRATATKK